jgi:glycosyltransferase involved in cell wall biosynthesis
VKDLVSIIVTCYNHENYITQCLNSIYAQTYSNIELLIVNDGSTDFSGAKIEQLLPTSPFKHTEYVAQANAGICITRNKGLEWAAGEFILFVDSDNYLEYDYVEKLVQTAVVSGGDIIYSDLYNIETQEVFVEAKEFDLANYLSTNFIDNCSLLRKEKIKNARYDVALNRKKLVDYDFIMNLILNNQAKPVKCYETKLNYRVLENSISRQNDHSTGTFYFEVYLYILEKYIDKFPLQVMKAVEKNVLNLAKRLDELIQHLGDVTEYVKNQEAIIKQLIEQVDNLQKDIENRINITRQLKLENNKLLSSNQSLQMDIQRLNSQVNVLETENHSLLYSTSYRLGNAIVKPGYYAVRAFKNPVLIKKGLGKVKCKVIRKLKKIPTLKTLYLRNVRAVQRKKNNYKNPRRMLIFVIYGNGEKLQEYKFYFLKEIAKCVEDVLIVVNGSVLKADLSLLEAIGHVELRANVGYDTAAFRYGVQYLGQTKLAKYDELLLVNDTNVGPISNLNEVFTKMSQKKLDFWGISYGEERSEYNKYNKYGYIPEHLQSFFLVIEKSLLLNPKFYEYWEALNDTDSRNKAIGKHETVFTKHFEELGYKHGALAKSKKDSPMYIHPLQMVKEGVPLIKYTAFANYNDDKFVWQGLVRKSEVPELLNYLREETNYPMEIIESIMFEVKNKKAKEHILIIDGVENAIPQLTTYRVQNKREQLESLGFVVWTVNLSDFQMRYAEHASHIIIYRAPIKHELIELIRLAKKHNKPVLYDIDDLVIDTKYTDQLAYVQNLSAGEKTNYDQNVVNYGEMLKLCDGVITSTGKMKEELYHYKDLVLLNRNLANQRLVEISEATLAKPREDDHTVNIGYFSGSITHNENFELIKPAIIKLLKKYSHVHLHLVGHLDIPTELKAFNKQIKTHPYVPWEKLPELIHAVDINLAPLVTSIFNEAKSEIKWIEAALVKVPTVASNLGAFKEMIVDGETGILANDDEWFDKLEAMVHSVELRNYISGKAYDYVMRNAITKFHEDELFNFLKGDKYENSEK